MMMGTDTKEDERLMKLLLRMTSNENIPFIKMCAHCSVCCNELLRTFFEGGFQFVRTVDSMRHSIIIVASIGEINSVVVCMREMEYGKHNALLLIERAGWQREPVRYIESKFKNQTSYCSRYYVRLLHTYNIRAHNGTYDVEFLNKIRIIDVYWERYSKNIHRLLLLLLNKCAGERIRRLAANSPSKARVNTIILLNIKMDLRKKKRKTSKKKSLLYHANDH